MPLTSREQVLQLLAVEPAGLSAPELLRRIRPRISQPTLWRVLDGLRTDGRVAVEGRGRATRYHSTTRIDLPALRSLRLHQVAARHLAADPQLRQVAHERLHKLRTVNPHGRAYQDRWADLVDGPLPALLRVMTEASEQADALRKESPMTVLVSPEERRRVFTDVRAT
jgi:Fe2+ or Zn2+ uptake regulation protein